MATRIEEAAVRRRRPAETALVVLAILAVIAAAKIAEAFLVPVIVGILLSYSLKPLVAALERLHIHRAIGSAIVLTLLGGVIAGGVMLLRDDANAALAELPNAARKVRMAARESAQKPEGPMGHVRAAAEELNRAATEAASGGKATAPAPAPAPQPTQIQRWISEQSSKALDVVIDIGIAGLLAYFLLAVGDAFRRKLVRVAGPTLTARRITVEILDEIDAQVQRYLLTMLIINTLIGVATWGILAAFGMVWKPFRCRSRAPGSSGCWPDRPSASAPTPLPSSACRCEARWRRYPARCRMSAHSPWLPPWPHRQMQYPARSRPPAER